MSELEDIVKAITSAFGKGSAFKMTELPETGVTGWTSTGCSAINKLIGRDGIPDGRVTTIIGPPSSSKTTLLTHIMAEHQKRGGIPFYWNTECSYEPTRAERMGLDLERVVISQPGTCEEAFEMLGVIAENSSGQHPILIGWDTFSATPLRSEVYGTGEAGKKRERDGIIDPDVSMGGHSLGEHSRLTSQQLRKLQGRMEQKNITLVTVLQSKMKIGLVWGSGITYLAEKPWYFYSNVQLECRQVGKVKSGETVVGIQVKITCRKNKVGPPFKECIIDCLFEDGLDSSGSLLERAVEIGMVQVTSKGRFAYTGSDGELVKFTRAGKKGLNWKKLLEQYPQIRSYLENQGG